MNKGHFKSAPLEERFWSKVNKTEYCWEWCGSTNSTGRGQIYYNGKSHLAHRISWFIHHGEMPHLFVCHKCDNGLCIRPDHLFLGTQTENMRDCVNKGRFVQNINPVRGANHCNAILDEAGVVKILRLRSEGMLYREIAEIMGVKKGAIAQIMAGANWKHVPRGDPALTAFVRRLGGAPVTIKTGD